MVFDNLLNRDRSCAMHVTILTVGTRGDIQPYVALGRGLKQAGYRVRIATSKTFESFVTRYGLEFFPINVDVFELSSSGKADGILGSTSPLKYLFSVIRTFGPVLEQVQHDSWKACQNTDAIIYHQSLPNSYFIARHLGVPCFLATLYPISMTRTQPHVMFYNGPRLGDTYNWLTYELTDEVGWQICRPSIQKFWRKQINYSSVPFVSPHRRQRGEGLRYLYGYSHHVFPRPADWPDHLHITGYWFLDDLEGWEPPADLLQFLASGPPPVYVGFGSMSNRNTAHETTQIVLSALARSGQRGILATGWGGLADEVAVPDNVYVLRSVPHSWLFPKMAAVVHHGGAGTTAAGLRAGIPPIIIPHTAEQPAWGRRVEELGVGPAPIARKNLTAEQLANAITRATTDEGMRARAALLGHRIRDENGVEQAVKVFSRYTRLLSPAPRSFGRTPSSYFG